MLVSTPPTRSPFKKARSSKPKISLLIPTRSRPHRIKEFVSSVENTVEDTRNVEVVLYLDDDDSEKYNSIITNKVALRKVVGPRQKYLSRMYNIMLERSRGDILFYGADDIIFCNSGWDRLIINKFQKRRILLCCNDFTHGFVSRFSCRKLGYFFPPYFEHGYSDHWLREIYSRAGRFETVKPSEICILHKHWHADKRLLDNVYLERSVETDENGLRCDDRDEIVYNMMSKHRMRDGWFLAELAKYDRGINPEDAYPMHL